MGRAKGLVLEDSGLGCRPFSNHMDTSKATRKSGASWKASDCIVPLKYVEYRV